MCIYLLGQGLVLTVSDSAIVVIVCPHYKKSIRSWSLHPVNEITTIVEVFAQLHSNRSKVA